MPPSTRVSWIDVLVEDRSERRARESGKLYFLNIEFVGLTKTGDENSATALRHPIFRRDNPRRNVIAKLLAKHVHDRGESLAAVVRFQILHILKKEGRWAVVRDYLRGIEKQRPLRVAKEAVRASQSILLRHPGNRKRLARKTGQQDVIIRNQPGFFRELADVALNRPIIPKIFLVGLNAVFVPFRREDAGSANRLEASAQAADGRFCTRRSAGPAVAP